jgi:excisionase family DNA binding protein
MIDNVPLPRLVSLNEASQITSLSRSALYRLIASGELRRVKAGGKVTFLEADIRTWIESRVAAADQQAA